jgi:hypothetical protein
MAVAPGVLETAQTGVRNLPAKEVVADPADYLALPGLACIRINLCGRD